MDLIDVELEKNTFSCKTMTYIQLLSRYLSDVITTEEFEKTFLERFKNEKHFSSDFEFNVLDTLFGDVDAYCDVSLNFDPDTDLTEQQLKESVKKALEQLKRWQ